MAHIGLLRCSQTLKQISPQYARNLRWISTSGKKRETVSTTIDKAQTSEAECKVKKNWVSYGFHFEDETTDRNAMHSTMFTSITLCIVIGGFVWAYMPDFKLRNWAQREAYLELRRREASGLPSVDRNLISPENIELPSDEELGDFEIII